MAEGYSEELPQKNEDSRYFSKFSDVKKYGKPHLDQVMNLIGTEIPGDWEEVGIQLKISPSKLDAIKVNSSLGGDPKKMFCEVMKLWERQSHSEAPYNWETILNVMSSPAVDRSTLAHEVAQKIENKPPLPTQESNESLNSSTNSSNDSTGYYTDDDLKKLCGCGECSLEDIINKGCSKSDAMPRFPILDVSNLPPCKRQQYEYILTKEANEMNEAFAVLIDDIRQSLCDQQIDPKSVITYLNALKLFQTTANKHVQLDKAKDIGDIFKVLSCITSWFNHHPLGKLVKRYGSDKDSEAYRKFLAINVKEYLQRSVTEIPKDAFSLGIEGSGKFKLKLDHPSSHEHINGQQISFLIGEVAKTLNIGMECLHWSYIEKGCLRLEFSIPSVIYEELFSPLSIAQWKEFETIAVEGPNNIAITIKYIEYEEKILKIPVPPETIFFAKLYQNLPGIIVTYSEASKDIQKTFQSTKLELNKLEKNKNKVDEVDEIKAFYRCLDSTKQAAYNYLECVCEIPKKLSKNSDPVMKEVERGESQKLEELRYDMNNSLDKSEQLYLELTDKCHELVNACESAAEVCEKRKKEEEGKATATAIVGTAASIALGVVTFGIGGVIAGAITAAIVAYFAIGAAAFKDIGNGFRDIEASALVQLQKNINDARIIQLQLANQSLEIILKGMEREAKRGYEEAAKQLDETKRILDEI